MKAVIGDAVAGGALAWRAREWKGKLGVLCVVVRAGLSHLAVP